jgi:adhesin HecA-like repeat protein
MLMLVRTNLLPDCNGVAATILLTITDQQLDNRTGLVATGHGAHISVDEALTLAGDARIMPVVLGKTRQITAYGTAHRIFTEGQRLAMIARDQGCSFPGCTAPPAWCQAHHVTDFSITRRTSVDDGTLLCGFHHREHPRLGWTCQMIHGTPHWTAPHWIDPTQTPRRNRSHEPALT